MPNYYEILEVDKNASEIEIKKAYRGLSLKWHPDRNPSPEAHSKIQEINEAYETLSDSGKREKYNNELNGVHHNGFEMHMDGMSGDMNDIGHIFNMMFNGGMPGMPGMPGMHGIHVFHGGPGGAHFSMGGGPGINIFHQMQKPPPIIKNIQIPFHLAYTGCTLHAQIEKWVIRNQIRTTEIETVYVPVPAGIDDGEIIVIRDSGNTVSDDLKGDVKFVIALDNNTPFLRKGMDLLYKKTVTLKEALTGFSFEVQHVNGKNISVNNQVNHTIVKPGYTKSIPGLGMVRDNNTGCLNIEFSVEFPETLTEDQIAKLSEIL
jgi:DnaJ family protein B protein 4